MHKVLEQLNTVPEVVGSMVCTETGALKAQIFPAIFDATFLQKAANAISGGGLWAGPLTGNTGLIDLRYSDGRIIGRTLRGGVLFVLCTKAVNLQLLNISLNVAKSRLEDLLPAIVEPSAPAPAAQIAPTAVMLAANNNDKILVVDELDASSEAGRGFQELGMAAVSANTAQKLCGLFQVASIKKLRLTKSANGNAGSFGVMIFNDDSSRYDGKIVLSRQIERKLQAVKDDSLLVELA